MDSILNELLKSSLAGAGLTITLLVICWMFRNRIPAFWIHLLLLLAVLRFLWLFPLPASPVSWEHWLKRSDKFTVITLDGISSINSSAKITSTPVGTINEADALTAEGYWNWKDILLFGWLAGFALIALTILTGIYRFHRILINSTAPEEGHRIYSLLENAAATGNLKQRPKLVFCDQVETPAIGGVFQPVILMPQSAMKFLNDDEIESILLHELGHLHRRDLLVNYSLLLIQAIHWFNPLSWYLCHRVRITAERATDEWVMKKIDSQSRKIYGNALLSLLDHAPSLSLKNTITVGVAEGRNDLQRRILAIRKFRSKTSRLVAPGCIILLGILSTVGLSQAPPETDAAFKITATSTTHEDFKTIYKGEVLAIHPDYRIEGDRFEVQRNKDKSITSWIAVGTPARISRKNIKGENQIATGDRISFDTETGNITVKGGPPFIKNGEQYIKLDSKKAGHITLKPDKDYTVFSPNPSGKSRVIIPTDQGDMNITALSINVEEVDGIKSVIFEGEVEVKRPDCKFRSDRLEVLLGHENKANGIIASGNLAEFSQQSKDGKAQFVKARKIIFDPNTKGIKISGGPASFNTGKSLIKASSEEEVIKIDSKGNYQILTPEK